MPEIAVVGGGFVGLGFALAAGKRGFDVVVYDRAPPPLEPQTPGSNVIALNSRSREFLSSIDAMSGIPEYLITPYQAMTVIDGEGTGQITFTAQDAGMAELGHIVDQAALRWRLAQAAEDRVTVNWETEADLADIDAELLVAADGTHSVTREKLGFKKLGYRYDQRATVCTVKCADRHQATACQWFLAHGPLALLPLAEPNTVAVIWSHTEDLSALDASAFLDQLDAATEGMRGSFSELGPRFSFPLQQQAAVSYVKPGAALLGDAAHTIHPLAGQGANLGFADAECLARELGMARIEGQRPGALGALKRFERTRMLENRSAALAMEGFHRLFTSDSPVIGLLRSKGLGFVHENKVLKRLAVSVAAGGV